jgi:hypothetical protein
MLALAPFRRWASSTRIHRWHPGANADQTGLAFWSDAQQIRQFHRQRPLEHQATLALAAGGAAETQFPLGQFHGHPALAHTIRAEQQQRTAHAFRLDPVQQTFPHGPMADQHRIEHYSTR